MSETGFLVLAWLSVYVTARTITREEGPWHVFQWIRNAAGRLAAGRNPLAVFLADVIHCAYCLSGYLCLGAAVIHALNFDITPLGSALVWLGLYGAVTFLLMVEDK